MNPVLIQNPVINSPFIEPQRHFRFTDEGITDEILPGRRQSEYFIPIPKPKIKLAKQASFQGEGWTSDRLEQNPLVNEIRQRVSLWRKGGYLSVTNTTRRLLEYWQRPGRERRLFFYQIEAAARIYQAIVSSTPGEKRLLPRLRSYDKIGSTRYVDFDTARDVYKTDPYKYHISHVVLDSSWEAKIAQVLESLPAVRSYVKNQGLGFNIPYTYQGKEHNYVPDYIVHLDDGHGLADLLNLIIEVSGEPKPEKAAKVAAARHLWIPAVNNAAEFGRWAFLEITDPWAAADLIQAILRGEKMDGIGPLLRNG